MTTYDAVADRTTVWVWQRAPKWMRVEGVAFRWKALFWFHGDGSSGARVSE